MHTHVPRGAPRSPVLVRSGVTASAVAVILAGNAGVAAAHEVDAGDAADVADARGNLAEAVDYPVQPGDYLAAIAADHGLDPVDGWRRLFDANPGIADPDVITVGEVVRIPAADEEIEPRALPAPPEPRAEAPSPAPADTTDVPQQSTTAEPAPAPDTAPATTAGVWDRLAQCESGGNWSANTGNGYYGGLQFSQQSWQAVGGSGSPHEASRAEQIQRAEQLRAAQGWGAWPSCSSQLGLR